MTTADLLTLCLIRRCSIIGEARVTTRIATWLNLPRPQVLKTITALYRLGYVRRLTSPVLTGAGERMAADRYIGWVGGELKLFEIVRRY